MALACECFHITFLNNLLLTSGISKINMIYCPSQSNICTSNFYFDGKLKNQPDVRSSFHLQNKPYLSFGHPIFLEIIFKFQETVKDHNENEVIHAQGLIFCLEMILTHIYGHHFMTLRFFFHVMITLRMWIKAFPEHDKTNTTLPKKYKFALQLGSKTNLTEKFMILISGKAEKKTLVWVSQWWVDLSNTNSQPHKLELGRPTKYPLQANTLFFLLGRWATPTATLPQAYLQIFQGYCLVPCHHKVRQYVVCNSLINLLLHPQNYKQCPLSWVQRQRLQMLELFLCYTLVTAWQSAQIASLFGVVTRVLYAFKMTSSQFTIFFFVELQRISTEIRTKFTKNQAKLVHNLQPTNNRYQLSTLQNKLSQLPALDMQKLPGNFCCYSNLYPRVIQLSFDAQSLCILHIDCAKTFKCANRWGLDDSLAGPCCMSTSGILTDCICGTFSFFSNFNYNNIEIVLQYNFELYSIFIYLHILLFHRNCDFNNNYGTLSSEKVKLHEKSFSEIILQGFTNLKEIKYYIYWILWRPINKHLMAGDMTELIQFNSLMSLVIW
ncbi:putative signal peptide protein [Puccinia sorghi]|uniref:Putative signal peptide protein n=1 Tax=Puccinia sorghi TaxID=27349 RepID=A0A0L6V262_9BASI|nr:putative signal peptide protein [Puccinia sorghi]